MFLLAFNSNIFPEDHVTLSLTKISPFPSVAPSILLITTWLFTKLDESVAPDISPPLAAIVKSFGSINQVFAFILVPSAIFTLSPDVSTNPPSAFISPLTLAVPPWANTSTFPLKSSIEFASRIPVLFTTPFSNSFTAFVVKYISPPFAVIVPEFSTIESRTPFVTTRFTIEFPFRFIVYSFAPLRWTLPFIAFIVPEFLTSFEANTTYPLFTTSIVPRFTTEFEVVFLKL